MKLLKFVGYSDDTFACEGPGIDVDRDTCASGDPVYMRVEHGANALVVCGWYCPGPAAGWLIGISPADFGMDERHIPEWPTRFERSKREYSPMLCIEAPDGVTVTLIDNKGRAEPRTKPERDALVSQLRQANDGLTETLCKLRRELGSAAETMRRLSSASPKK